MKNSLYLRPAQLEILEERIAPAALVVTNNNDNGAGSLRQAIVDSNAHVGKDTIIFDKTTFADPKIITLMTNLDAITDSLVIKGPGADKVTIDGANTYSIFDITDNTTEVKSVAISGLSLIHGKSATTGGAIHSTESLTVKDCVLSGNTAVDSGGGLRFEGMDAKLLIQNSQFQNDSAGFGGGLSALASGTGSIKIVSSTFSDNQATAFGGGGMFIATAFGTKGSVLIDKCSILHNSTITNGGGISLLGNAEKSSITLRNTVISGNTSVQHGGGIYADEWTGNFATKVTLDKVTISNNTAAFAGDAGGGLAARGTAEDVLIIKKSRFLNNSATDAMGSGGGIGLGGVADLVVNISGSTISGNEAAASGGGIVSDITNLTINSSTISGNLAGSDGGGIASHKDNAVVSISKSSFADNQAVGNGGGIYITGATTKLNLNGSLFNANEANKGGGVFVSAIVSASTALTVTGSNFEGNIGITAGGGICVQNNVDKTDITGSTFTGNVATFGGGLFISNGAGAGEIHIGSSKLIGNSSTMTGGAALLGSDGIVTLSKNLIEQNHAVSSGGGISFAGTGAKILTSNVIHANTSDLDGGGIFLSQGTLALNKDTITGNVAGSMGGGIRNNVANSPIVNNGAKIIGNSAPTDPNLSEA